MRIAFFVDAFPDLALTFIIDQVVGLLERGHDVRIFAFARGRMDRSHPVVRQYGLLERTTWIGPKGRRWRRFAETAACIAQRPRHVLPFVRDNRRDPSDSLRTYRNVFAARAFAEPLEFDAIHCHFAPNGVTAVLLRRAGLLWGPVVTTFHGYDMRDGVDSRGAIYAPLRDDGDRFLSISSYNAGLLNDWGFPSERIVEHRVGIDVEDFTYRTPRTDRGDEIRVLCVANLVPVKGHDVLVDALGSIRDRHPGLRVRLVGEGPERANLERRITNAGLQDVVTLVGGLPRPEVARELAAADVFVLPSRAEATPVALMEAQACGLPVIATQVGAVHEVIVPGESGVLVAPGDMAALARALDALASAPETWSGMGETGRCHVEATFHLPVLVDQLEVIYREARESHRSTSSGRASS